MGLNEKLWGDARCRGCGLRLAGEVPEEEDGGVWRCRCGVVVTPTLMVLAQKMGDIKTKLASGYYGRASSDVRYLLSKLGESL